MGFFDFLMDCAKAIGRGVGGAIASAGSALGMYRVEQFGNQLKSSCSTVTRKIKEEAPVENIYRAPVQQVERVNNIFADFYSEMESKAEEIEESCIAYVESYFEELVNVLEESGKGILKKQNFTKLASTKRKIRSDISGAIGNEIATKISMDNYECKEILRMKDADARAEKMEEYCQEVVEKAVDKLNRKVEKTLRKQNDEIIGFLEEYVEKRELELEKKVEQLEEMEIACSDAENDVVQLIEPIKLYVVADTVMKLL